MNILFIGPLPEPVTGQSLACKVFYDHLVKKHHVDLINLSKSGFAQGMNSVGRVLEVLRFIWEAWRKSRKADVIYFTVSESLAGNAKDLLIFLACFDKLPRMAIHLHGGAGMRLILDDKRPLLKSVNAFFLGRIGIVIVLGRRLADIYRGVVADSRLQVVPNFAEDELFIEPDDLSRKFNRPGPLRILFLSNHLPGKGHVELALAYLALDRSVREEVEIDFAGSFESEEQKSEFLAMIEGSAGLRYHGPVRGQEKLALFRAAQIFCLPTYYPYEGQPISILEAYASGCAVITSDHSGIPDIFQDCVNGLLVEAGSPTSIRRAIEHAVAERSSLMQYALHNRGEADVRYRTPRYNNGLCECLAQIGSNTASGGSRT